MTVLRITEVLLNRQTCEIRIFAYWWTTAGSAEKETEIFAHLLNKLLFIASILCYFRCHSHVSSNSWEMSIFTLSQLALQLYTSINEQLIITQSGNWYADRHFWFISSAENQEIKSCFQSFSWRERKKKILVSVSVVRRAHFPQNSQQIVSNTTAARIPARQLHVSNFHS